MSHHKKIVIRRAISELDAERILTLHGESFTGGREDCPSLDKGAWWLLFKNKKPVAFAGIHPSNNYVKTAYLCRVAVSECYRGMGFQKKLIQVREKWAKQQGYKWVITDSAPNNPASSNSLINCRYKLWIPVVGWALYRPVLYWRKKL